MLFHDICNYLDIGVNILPIDYRQGGSDDIKRVADGYTDTNITDIKG